MTRSTLQALDPIALPLWGDRLIEASAGTGKTFTLSLLYLRLLLGLDGGAHAPRPLTVNEILVVTFTEAATAELRCRIREMIQALRQACVTGESRDALLQQLLACIVDRQAAVAQLLAAERQLDEAAIYTIHGFCQRMLSLGAFESALPFAQQIIEDESKLRYQVVSDFWRCHFYPLPVEIISLIVARWRHPQQLLHELLPMLKGDPPQLQPTLNADETLEARHRTNVQRIDALKQAWCQAAAQISAIITCSGVSKASYSKKNLPAWLQSVTLWATSVTRDYTLPPNLYRFSQRQLQEKSSPGAAPQHAIFQQIDHFLAQPLTLDDVVVTQALAWVRKALQHEKAQRSLMGFDDLLSQLDCALATSRDAVLATTIRQRFPAAMIDEFQDTDPQQYRIFRAIYPLDSTHTLILIGDPKQAIYAFRGADIFTYLQAKNEIAHRYTLRVNWRSSPAMVASINALFSPHPAPFVFADIPFTAVTAAERNQSLRFTLQQQTEPALRFWLQPGEGISQEAYLHYMANQCATEISRWLLAGQHGEAHLCQGGQSRPLQAADIAVLVRQRTEAKAVRAALNRYAIPSVYLSERDSVYNTPEAKELLGLLQAILAPEQERLTRAALATSLLGVDAATLVRLGDDFVLWEKQVDMFAHWQTCWRQKGVLAMLRQLMVQRGLAETLLASVEGERRLTDLMHLGELLQQASTELDSPEALVRYLAQKIAAPDNRLVDQQLRLESDRHVVQIITIHKAKGLEYPIVWLPFAVSLREQQTAIYHHRQTLQRTVDLHHTEESVQLACQERLAEDLRLLYVALTRAVYHCSLGIASVVKGKRKKSGPSDVHKSAIGWLLLQGQAQTAAELHQTLRAQCNDDSVLQTTPLPQMSLPPAATARLPLASRTLTRRVLDDWRVTSFSALQRSEQTPFTAPLLASTPPIEAEVLPAVPTRTRHTFARGAAAGTFLHGLLEQRDLRQVADRALLEQQLLRAGVDTVWLDVLQQWMTEVITASLDGESLSLSALQPGASQAELAFMLPIQTTLTASKLDALLAQHNPLSARALPLHFQQVAGMLKGFIDLVFCWQGKYYLLDYKSNWLGPSDADYTDEAMQQAMIAHRYDVQYHFYALALHRHLQLRLQDYHYQRHFGGVYYLFMRGISVSKPTHGIYYCRPTYALMLALDRLFGAGVEG